MALWSEILQRLVGNYQNKKKYKKVNFDFPPFLPKDTLVRKFPLSPPKGYSGEKIIINCMYFLKAKPGRPPSMVSSMAKHLAGPIPGPVKRKYKRSFSPVTLRKNTLVKKFPHSLPKGYSGEKNKYKLHVFP